MGYWARKSAGEIKKLAQEAIKHQDRKKLQGLADVIGKFRARGEYTPESYRASGIPTYIDNTFGIAVTFRTCTEILGADDFYFAGIETPEIDKNNPIIPSAMRWVATSRDLNSYTKLTKKSSLVGTVDRDNAYIGGGFSKINSTLYVSVAMFTGGTYAEEYHLTDLELAAVISHELGHVFSYFENLTSVLMVNVAVASAVNRLMDAYEPKARVEVLLDFEKYAKIKFDDKDAILDSVDKSGTYLHIVTELMRQPNSLMNTGSYEVEQWERASDDFATRLGAGAELASSLVKFHKTQSMSWFGDRSMVSTPAHIAIEIATIGMVIATGAAMPNVGALMLGLVMGINDPQANMHGTCEERFLYIRQQMVDELKVIKGGSLRKKILNDISRVDDILATTKDKATIANLLWNYVFRRNDHKNKNFHKELESYMFNDLYVSSAKLQ